MAAEKFHVLENEWITLSDGTRLAARIWMPEGNGPFPAVLEFLPYRKRGGTSARDESTYPAFAEAGIAGVRVDIRGSGESEGVIDGEYTPLELADACEVIDWITGESWNNGSVGMMGISWGGFNCLQVAALRPPALKAVISLSSTVDRYNDDIHYKNGCHLSAQLGWAATMLAYQSRPPDPALVGDHWKSMWLQRLENEPYFMEEWLSHQRRDSFWKHGSICEDFAAVEIPALVIAGWADGYRNTPLRAVEGLGQNAKALIGPWVHKYPHFAWPKPRADFLGEAIRWWRRWLDNEDNGAERLPQVRAYILDAAKPAPRRDFDPGRWIAIDDWAQSEGLCFHIDPAGRLAPGKPSANAPAMPQFLKSPLDTGTASGEYFTLKPDAEMAGDQRADDAGSLTFETAPLDSTIDLLGRPFLQIKLTCKADTANLAVRLVDIHPDGTATRVSYGVLNLAHRNGNETPEAMPHNQAVEVAMQLDACGYRFRPGHRIRLSISTAYWPLILPPPTDPGLQIASESICLTLPELGVHQDITVEEPDNPDPLPRYFQHLPAATLRTVTRDLSANKTEYRIFEDHGLTEHPDNGLATGEVREETWSIGLDDPLSMEGRTKWTTTLQRPGWHAKTVSETSMTCDAENWIISARVEAYEGEDLISEKTFAKKIPRDFM